jgi:hypothetical protein
MCYVAAAWAAFALTVATTAYTTYNEDQNVKAQNRFNQKAADEGSELAKKSFTEQAGSVRLRQTQEAEAANNEIFENNKRAAEARATARVSAGEAGVSGLSVDALNTEFYREQLGFNSSVNRNLGLTNAQADADVRGLRSGALDRSNSFMRSPIARPSYLAAGLNVANSGVNIYDRYRYTSANASGTTTKG